MQLKKLLQGSAFALVAAACAIAVPSVAKAASGDGALATAGITSVEVDGTIGEMTITPASGKKEVLVGVGKVNAKKGTISVATWDTYEVGTGAVTVDLSKLSNVKDNYIVVTTPGNEVSIVKIPAADKVIKAKFNAGTGELQIGKGATGSAAAPAKLTLEDVSGGAKATVGLYEYRTAYGNWADLKDKVTGSSAADKKLDLSIYQEEGAKLFIRAKGQTSATLNSTPAGKDEFLYGTNTAKIKVYDAAVSLPSKEAKVTIPAKAKGPKATADYAKGTIKFPKNSEYRLSGDGKLQSATNGKYVDGPTTATAIADVLKNANDTTNFPTASTKEFNVEVRTKETDKKAASKWSTLAVTVPAKMDSTTATPSVKTPKLTAVVTLDGDKTEAGKLPAQSDQKELKGVGGGIKTAKVEEVKDTNALAINYVVKGKIDASKYYTANAIEITNNGKNTYEVVVTANATTAPAADAKATKIAPTKKVVLTKVADGAGVWIRIAGDKKTMTWVGDYANLGLVDFPFTIPKKESTTPGA